MKKARSSVSGYGELQAIDCQTGEEIEAAATQLEVEDTLIEKGYAHFDEKPLSREQWNRDYASFCEERTREAATC
ncbi:MAG: hypothetical protein PHV05_05085 [Candidatus Riflebacteria bacterium]|nr:hypothetical protein [Candidatus Riflebacteria bacterium]